MARDFAESFYHSAAWKKCRAAYIKHRQSIDGGICERCHKKLGKIIHHKTHLTPDNINDPDVTLSFDNLTYVCHECHNIIHGYAPELPDRMIRYEFGPDGSPVPLRSSLRHSPP